MFINKEKVSETAELYLDGIISNNFHSSLDLPERIDKLVKNEWIISFIKESEFYNIPVYVAEIEFLYKNSTVANYKLYLSEELEFIDSFFITY